MVRGRRLNVRVAGFCEVLARGILAALMLVLVLAIARAVVDLALSLADLRLGTNALLEHQVVGALTVLSVLEVYRTVQTYFTAGRVKVTYVLETALVGMVTELVALWFSGTSGPALLADRRMRLTTEDPTRGDGQGRVRAVRARLVHEVGPEPLAPRVPCRGSRPSPLGSP